MQKPGAGGINHGIFLMICWTIVIASIITATILFQHQAMRRNAENEARDYFRLNLYYRKWASTLGGVYAPIEKVVPNPFMAVQGREVTTNAGQTLTLVNPAYMTSMVFQELRKASSTPIISKITSLQPINPKNAPDPWEQRALEAFQRNDREELSQELELGGRPYLRFISRFRTDKSCLKCHQGYKVGDVRGAISISVPLEPHYAVTRMHRNSVLIGYTLLWGLGSAGILFSARRQQQYERQLEASEEKFRTVCDWNHDWEYWIDPAGKMLYVSPSVEQITGYPPEAFMDDSGLVERLIHPEDREKYLGHMLENIAHSHNHEQIDFRIIRRDGEIRWISHVCRTVGTGEDLGRRVSNRDITKRKTAEHALRRSESFNSTINRISKSFLSNTDDRSASRDMLDVLLDVMDSEYGLFGYVDDNGTLLCTSLDGSSKPDYHISDGTEPFLAEKGGCSIWCQSLTDPVPRYSNERLSVPSGHMPVDRWVAAPLKDRGTVVGLVVVANRSGDYSDHDRDFLGRIVGYITPIVTARMQQQQAARALRQSHERYALLYSSMIQGMVVMEAIMDGEKPADYRFLDVNPAYERIIRLSRGEIIGRTLKDVLPELEPQWIEAMDATAVTGKPTRLESHSDSIAGDFQVYNYSPQPGIVAVLINDVTDLKREADERKALELQVMHAQKLESLGVLAGGIAHDFNNILTIILGHCQIIRGDFNSEMDLKTHVQHIEKAADRAAELCRQMMSYAGKKSMEQTQVNLWLLIDENIKMLHSAIKKNVKIESHLKYDLPAIAGDSAQIQQLIMNLIINGAEAIGDRNGTVRIDLTRYMVGDEEPEEQDFLGNPITTGEYACITVTDDGCGMNEETQKKIFEPFFTTKFTGRGLGMSAILGIMKLHGGSLQLSSSPGIGTTFRIFLPLGAPVDAADAAEAPGSDSLHGHGTILLVDDEEEVRLIDSKILQAMGYSVVTASNGREALEVYARRKQEIDIVLLDTIMPEMGGIETYRALRSETGTLPIILCSGCNIEELKTETEGDERALLAQKPFRAGLLGKSIAQLLQVPAPPHHTGESISSVHGST